MLKGSSGLAQVFPLPFPPCRGQKIDTVTGALRVLWALYLMFFPAQGRPLQTGVVVKKPCPSSWPSNGDKSSPWSGSFLHLAVQGGV